MSPGAVERSLAYAPVRRPIAQLPDGVANAEAEAILPHTFAERLRPITDGVWIDGELCSRSGMLDMLWPG